ncbi:MAG: DMT family transporter [Patescibacteria group bacterium]
MPWYFYALLSTLFFAAQDLLMRVLAIKSGVPRVFSVVFNLWGAFFAILAFVIQGGSFYDLKNLTPITIILIICAVILYGFYERTHFSARKGIDASSFAIIFRLTTVIAFVGSILFLHESITIHKFIGAFFIISASFFLIYKNIKLKISRSFWLAILSALLLGIVLVIDKPASAYMQPALYSFIVWCFPVFIVAFPNVPLRQLKKEFFIGGWKVALTALLNVTGYMLFIQALTMTDASRVVVVDALTGIFVVLGGIVILKEHDHIGRKIIAAIIAFVGVYLLR